MKKIRKKSLESSRTKIGYTFVIHWLIGIFTFFILPIISSIRYSFSEVVIKPGEVVNNYVGFEHYKNLLTVDPNYVNDLRDSIGMMFYSLPFIISLSLILAILLNGKFKGRALFRCIFFLPVIISGSVVMNALNSEFITMPLFTTGKSGTGIIDYTSILANLNIPSQVNPILTFLLSNTIEIIWKCGVQTILFLAGLQSIPDSLYEVSKIEGANKWEEFWWITVPSLRNVISLVLIYTMIVLFVDNSNTVVARAYNFMTEQSYGNSSAMLWFYFMIVLVLIGTVYGLYQKFCMKHWE